MTATTTSELPAIAARLRRNQTTAFYAAFIALGLVMASLGPTLPGLAAHTRSSLSAISVLFTAQALGTLIGNFGSGRLYDRAPAYPFLAAVVLVIAAMLVLTPLVTSLAVLAALMFVVGLGAGAIDVGGNTLLGWIHREEVGPRMNALHFFFGLGALLAPLFVAQAIGLTGGIAWAYWLLAALILPVAVLFLRQPSPLAPARIVQARTERTPRLPVLLIATMFFLFVGAELSFGGWIYTYAVAMNVATATTAGYLTSLFWGALTLGRLLSIPLAGRIRPRAMLLADITGLIVALALLLLFPHARAVVWVATFGFGISMANVYPTLVLLGGRHLQLTGAVTSWFMIGGSLGSMIVPWLIGQRFEAVGPQVTMLILLATIVLAALALAGFLVVSRPRPARDGAAS